MEFSLLRELEPATSIHQMVLGVCMDIQARLPRTITNDHLSKQPQHPLAPIIQTEIAKYNTLLDLIFHSLDALANSIRGTDIQFSGFDQILYEIANNKIPFIWLHDSYATSKSLSSYVVELLKRIRYFEQAICNGPSVALWFAAFYYPQAILASVKQEFGRRKHIEHEDVCVTVHVTSYDSPDTSEFKAFIKVKKI